MSVTQANSYIKKHILEKSPEIAEALYTDYRQILNSRNTILDLSRNALKVNLRKENAAAVKDYDNIYDKLVDVLADNFTSNRTYQSLEEATISLGTDLLSKPVYINGGDNNRFIIASSFEGIRAIVTNKISRDSRLITSRFGIEDNKSKLDIGHIATADNINLTSPLEEKILAVSNIGNPVIAAKAKIALENLYKIQADFTYSFKNTAPEAISTARAILGEGYIVVTLHSRNKNKDFSVAEGAIFRKLVKEIADTLRIEDIPGSNTIFQDVVEGITSILKTGKPALKSHSSVKSKVSVDGKKKANTNINGLSLTFPANKKTTESYSLASLESLVRRHLQNVVAANMGNGDSKDILNYRTGRLAASARLDKLTQSKEGMITAFYTYMRNPYGTFSEGGLQQYPRTRDPKLLIGGAIKEIVATRVANRMRAVLI